MNLKHMAISLAVMMVLGTLTSPLLNEFNDQSSALSDEEADVLNSAHGRSGQEYVDIDHSGYVYEHPNGTEVWASGSDVSVEFTSGNLTVGENYQLIWNLSDSTWNAGVYAYDWTIYWNATSNTSVENSTISGLADGVYYFHATLVNQGSHVATDMTMIQVGNSTAGSGGSTNAPNTGMAFANGTGDTSIVLAPGTEAVHIAHRGSIGQLQHTTDASGSWVTTSITPTYVNGQLDMVVASNGTLYVSFIRPSGNLSVAWSYDGGSTWSTRDLVDNGTAGGAVIASDLDTVHHTLTVTFQNTIHNTLTSIDLDTRFIGTHPLTVLTLGNTSLDTGRYSDVAVDGNGHWVTAYYHADNAADVRTINRAGPSLSTNSVWSGDQAVDTSGQTGTYVSVDTNSQEDVFISFHSGNELKVANWVSGQGWVATSVDGNASTNVGLDTSMFIEQSTDEVHVTYYDLSNKDLKYAVRDANGNWNTSTLDTAGQVGQASSIVVDSNGDCHISYIDYTNQVLKYYACSGAYASDNGSDGGSTGGSNGSGTSTCDPDVLLSTRPHNGGPNQTHWTYGVDVFDAFAHHTCLEWGVYDWTFELYDSNWNLMQNFGNSGDFHHTQGGSHFDFLVRNFEATDLLNDTYVWYYTVSNDSMGLSLSANHTFTVMENPVDPTFLNCSELDPSGIDGEVFIHNVSNAYGSGEQIVALLETCWTPSNVSMWYTVWLNHTSSGETVEDWSAQGAGNFPGWWYAVEHDDGHVTFPMDYHYGVADAWDLTIDSLPYGGEYCYEATLKVFDNVLGAFFHVDADGPTCFDVTNGTGDNSGNGTGNGTDDGSGDGTNDDLLGYCSFPTFEATPASVQSGDDLTFTWTMDGDISDEVYLSLSSGWGAQYYFSSVEDNDGSHTITLPANMNPNEDYTIYIESASNGQRTTVCWKYGAIDVLEDDEGVVLDDIINDFLNTTDERPRISMWYGKVNQHNENGTWMTDPDGTAGAGLYSQWGDDGWGDRKLEYCQRFWPDTVEIRNSAPEEIVFYTRGNTDAYLTTKPVWLCIQDTDGDGILDPEDDDDDGDGWADIFEDLCFSDALDANVVPEDLDGDGLCDVLQILLVGDFEPPEPGFCTDGEITGGNGLMGQDVYTELVVIEKTGGTYQYQYEIHDWTNDLHEDLEQGPSDHDFRGYYEYYDIFLSDADGVFNPNGSFVTVQARSDLNTQNLGVGHNIDSIGIRDANGNVLYASEVVSVVLGEGLGSNNPDGRQSAILGSADQIPTALGNNQASITVGFCPEAVEPVDEPSPGFGAMAALAALGAAMFAGRRGWLDEQDAE